MKSALDQLFVFTDSPKHAMAVIADAGPDVGLAVVPEAYQLVAAIISAAAKAAAGYKDGPTRIETQIKNAILAERQKWRDEVTQRSQHWSSEFAKLLGSNEPTQNAAALEVFKQSIEVMLPVVKGAAPQPRPTSLLYGDLLLKYASGRGWRNYISRNPRDEAAYGYLWNTNLNAINAGVLYHTDFPGITDPKDVAQELNAIGYR